MYIFVKNWLILALFFSLSVVVLFACAKKRAVYGWNGATHPNVHTGQSPHTTTHATPQQEPPPKHAFGNYFNVRDQNSYQRLLEHCRRCGTKRLHADGSYQRIWTLSDSNPKQCRNWLNKGYIQIEFLEDSLPSRAVVRIKPGYMNTSSGQVSNWGEAFEATATAQPINQDEGFYILLKPEHGLGGGGNLSIEAQRANHIDDNSLSISASYGNRSDGTSTFEVELVRLSKRAVAKPYFGCDTYTN